MPQSKIFATKKGIMADDRVLLPSKTEMKVREYARLPEGWFFGDCQGIEKETVTISLRLLREAEHLGLHDTNVFPGGDGELLLTIYHGDYYMDLMVEPDGTVDVTVERGEEELVCREGVSLLEAISEIGAFKKLVWKHEELSGYYAESGTTKGKTAGASTAWPLSRQEMEGSQYLNANAPWKPVEPSVSILSSFTLPDLVGHLFTGNSTPRSSPTPAG